MKKLFNVIVWACMLIPMTALAGKINKIHYKKTLHFSFNVNNNAHFQLSNKYGDITFYRWDKNAIQATVTISVKADNEEAAKRIAGNIQIDKNQNGNNASLITNYNSSSNSTSFWGMFFGESSSSRKSINIDYKVYLPKSLGELNVQNKYGDIMGNQIPGNVHIQLQYGGIHLSDIQKPLYLKVKYGEGSITDVASATINAAYTDFRIDKVKQLKMHYEYGDLQLGEVGSAVLDGSYGDIYADRITALQSNTSYSDYEIDYIVTSAAIETAYGDVQIDKTGNNLKQLHVMLRYSDLSVAISGGVPLKITANLQYGDLDVDLNGLQVVKDVDKGTKTYYQAHTSTTNGAVIQIDGQYSDVELENE